MKILRF